MPKLSQLPKFPATTMLPEASTATPVPESLKYPPALLDHSAAPAAEYFVTKMDQANELVMAPAPKFTVPKNDPVTTTFPAASTATPRPRPYALRVRPVPPWTWVDHMC